MANKQKTTIKKDRLNPVIHIVEMEHRSFAIQSSEYSGNDGAEN